MKNNSFMHIDQKTFWAGTAFLLSLTLILCVPVGSAVADDLDDIEADMETALSESEAAQSEASDAKKREQEEKSNLQKAKVDASKAADKAKAKEVAAKKEIKTLEGRTAAMQTERKKFEKQTAASVAAIAKFDKMIADKKMVLEKATGERDAARSEKDTQEATLAARVQEKKDIEQEIVKSREEAAKLTKEIANLKKDMVAAEGRLGRLRENARREADRREKIKNDRDQMKRKVSSVPKRVMYRSPKYDCEVLDQASDGARTLGHVPSGKRLELYKVVNGRWIEIQYGKRHAFVPKSCF